MKSYLVGGAVRDTLLGRPVSERDFVVVGATVEEMLTAGFLQVGKEFPVFLHPETKEEYALARTERKNRSSDQWFVVHATPDVTLEQDLGRRDLTINAIAQDLDGQLIDPFGGQRDLKDRILRHISSSFAEDPVRILRVARFAARYASLHFCVAHETMALMRQMVETGEIDALVPERVWQELVKVLSETDPAPFFQVLEQCGARQQLFPEIDTGAKAWAILNAAAGLSSEPEVRFAALTNANALEAQSESEQPLLIDKNLISIDALCERLKAPRRFHDLARLVARYHTQVEKVTDLSAASILQLLLATDASRRPERFDQFLSACEAIYRSQEAPCAQAYPSTELFRQALHAIGSFDIKTLIAGEKDSARIQELIRQQRICAIEQAMGSRVRSDDADSSAPG